MKVLCICLCIISFFALAGGIMAIQAEGSMDFFYIVGSFVPATISALLTAGAFYLFDKRR